METQYEGTDGQSYIASEPEIIKDQAWLAANQGAGERTPRWHYDTSDGRRFIVYGQFVAPSALQNSGIDKSADLVPSGYYCHVTNTIVDAQDGPTSFIDLRKSGGGSRG